MDHINNFYFVYFQSSLLALTLFIPAVKFLDIYWHDSSATWHIKATVYYYSHLGDVFVVSLLIKLSYFPYGLIRAQCAQ